VAALGRAARWGKLCIVGMGEQDDTATELFAEVAGDLVPVDWVPLQHTADRVRAWWRPEQRPAAGIVRMQLIIAVEALTWEDTGWEVAAALLERVPPVVPAGPDRPDRAG